MTYQAPLTITQTLCPMPGWTLHVGRVDGRTDGRDWVVEYHRDDGRRVGALGYERRYFGTEEDATIAATLFRGAI